MSKTSSSPSSLPVLYGQVVVGPPGSGKTTYCDGMQQYLRLLGRNAWVVNMDPANEVPSSSSSSSSCATSQHLPYDALLDVCDNVIHLSSVMEELELGPNGGLLYCMEYMERHLSTAIVPLLKERMQEVKEGRRRPQVSGTQEDNEKKKPFQSFTSCPPYLLLDMPGQVELYTHNDCLGKMVSKLASELNVRWTVVHLVDATFCSDVAKFVAAALLSTTAMIRLELPAVSVLTKVDLMVQGSELPLPLSFFCNPLELERLLPYLDSGVSVEQEEDQEQYWADDKDYQEARRRRRSTRSHRRFLRLHQVLCEVVQDYNLLSYQPLDISDATSVGHVVARIDQAHGYHYHSNNHHRRGVVEEEWFQCAAAAAPSWEQEHYVADIQERLQTSNEPHKTARESASVASTAAAATTTESFLSSIPEKSSHEKDS